MKYSAQLEREAERNRAEVEQTLEEIRSRLRPGQLMDQLVDYARDGAGGEFYGNLKRQVAENPLPVTVIGAGLAWLALSSNSSHPRRAQSGAVDYGATSERARGTVREAERRASALGEHLSDSVESTSGAISDTAQSVTDTARRGTARLRNAASSAGATVSDRLSSAYSSATDAASRATQSVSSAGHGLADRGRSFAEFCREQPLVLAGIGVALGAALGAVLPTTEAEDRLMGDAADETKERMQGIVGEQTDKAKAIAEDAADKAIAGAQETANSTLDSLETKSSPSREGSADSPTQQSLSDDVIDTEWTTRDGSGRAAETGGLQSGSGDPLDIQWPTRDGSGRAADSDKPGR
jgi:Protein of unknown function (DUF3618)